MIIIRRSKQHHFIVVQQGIAMEWLKEGVVVGLLALVSAWHWYDKTARDSRFTKLEERMGEAETLTSKQQTQLEVMNTELKAFSTLTDVRLGFIQSGIDKVIASLEKNNHEST